jgi:hypothetical protein
MYASLIALASLAALSAAQDVPTPSPGGSQPVDNRRCSYDDVYALARCDELFAYLDSGNVLGSETHACAGEGADRCCVAWTQSCRERTYADVRAKAESIFRHCHDEQGLSQSGAWLAADDCFGTVCLSGRPDAEWCT